jgi:hypothetical protein
LRQSIGTELELAARSRSSIRSGMGVAQKLRRWA